jgi:hypothetical protein
VAEGKRGHLETEDLPAYLRDRGEGVPSSMFGTFMQKGQLLVYPYFEYYDDANYECKPSEFGFSEDRDYRGDYEGFEYLLFLSYGLSDRLAFELEAAVIEAELESSEDDHSSLIGTTDWEVVVGTGVVRGFPIGTLAARVAIEYDAAEDTFEIGEIALEYLRRLSSTWRVYGAVEGTQDEWEFITEAQWHLSPWVFLKLNNAFGITFKAPDWAPEVGVMFSF